MIKPICLALSGLFFSLNTWSLPSSFPGSNQFDRLMNELIRKYHIPGASLSITKNGRLVYAKGFGYADLNTKEKMKANHLFRISSVSKPIAAVAVLKLVEQRKLSLDDKVYSIIGDTPLPEGRKINSNINKITVRDLLRHSSGQEIYNRSGRINSPMQPPISREISSLFSIPHPPSFKHVVGYMKTQPLLHPVGKNFKYSNYGYALLGMLVEKITSMPFETYVKKTILSPIDIQCMQFGKTLKSHQISGEVSYYDLPGRKPVNSVIDGESSAPFPYAGRYIQGWGAAGAWIASTVDIVKFVNHVDGQRRPSILRPSSIQTMIKKQNFPEHRRPTFWYGLGWRVQKKKNGHHWYHNGASNSGAAAIMLRTADGIAWSAHFNKRMPAGRSMYKEFNKGMWKAIRSNVSWPKGDLFKRYSACLN